MSVYVRINLTIALFTLVAVAMCVRLGYLEVFRKDFLQDQGDARTIRMERINAYRGMIKDRHGKPLAVSSPVISLWANPAQLPEDPSALTPVAELLEVEPGQFAGKLHAARQKNFVYLRRHMKPSQARAILALDVPGVHGEREYHRFYPSGEVGAHVVGYTNIDDRGQEGIELSFEHWLAGKPGKKKVLKNLHGDIVKDVMPVEEAVPGKHLELAMDLRLQYLAYRELKSAVTQYGAKSGSIVLLDVATGQVMAMVNQPSYNPNNRIELQLDSVRNRAVTDVFEPGSTIKPFTVAVAIESGGYTAESIIDTSPGFVKVGGKTIRDPRNRGELDLGGIIAHSSQVGITRLALTLDELTLVGMLQSVGFGDISGIGFPGERAGYMPNHRRWQDIEKVTLAYGYGLSVTPIQLASAYLTIASGGIYRTPTLIRQDAGGERRVMSAAVADAVKVMLERVVEEGTGSRAAIESFSVAGKTGTARKVGKKGYEDTRHLAFFAGMAPVDDPRLVGVVLINEPDMNSAGGGSIAAPVFSRVMAGALRLLNVPPQIDGRSA